MAQRTDREPPAPETVWGDGAIGVVPQIVEDGTWHTVLLVCGRQSFEASGAASMLPDLKRVAAVERWSDFDANPEAGHLLKGLERLKIVDPDCVIGIGGGSAMDMAKLLCAFDGLDDVQTVTSGIASGRRATERRRGLILAPTTSGTGSEATHFATVYVGERKFSVAGPALRADAVVLDPRLSLSATPYQKAASGIDAVCQAIESLWATQATPDSRRFARRSLRYLLPSIERFVDDPTPESAREMTAGSHLAGRAIDISRTTAAHALSYAITQRYGVSHGHAVALTMGSFLETHASPEPGALRPGVDPLVHAEVMREVVTRLGASGGSEAREHFLDLLHRLGLANRLGEAGVASRPELKGLAAAVNPERLDNNPVQFDEEGLLAVLSRAF